MRHYSATSGKYERESNSLFNVNVAKLSKAEKRYLRNERVQKELNERAQKSSDPLLLDTYNFLQNSFPNKITAVNEKIYYNKAKMNLEVDIICNNCIVEIKSGQRPRLEKQAYKQIDAAKYYGMKHIVYAPSMKTQAKISHEKNGIKIARNKKELFEGIK